MPRTASTSSTTSTRSTATRWTSSPRCPALSMCLVDGAGDVDYYHGRLRVVDEAKNVVDEFDYHDYLDHMSEAVEPWSYMKFPFLKAFGREAGCVRVGSLARLNVTGTLTTPRAAEALERFHAYTQGRANTMTLHTNWARTIEIIHAAEVVRDLLNDPDLLVDDLVVSPPADAWTGEGVGVVEAPRGVLLHHYRADPDGAVTFANLIVATTQNNQVLNRTVRAVAEEYLDGQVEITEGMMNAIEVGIRAYDPCFSCATHALGQMPLIVSVYDAERPAGAGKGALRCPTACSTTLDDPSCLIYGIGNVGRQDDGLGWAFVDWLEESRLCPRARLVRGYQLVLEDADLLARVRVVLFVDSTEGPGRQSFEVQRPLPHLDVSFTSHALSVPSVLATSLL